MKEGNFREIVEEEFFLRKIEEYFKSEMDLIYIGRENLAALGYVYEQQAERYRKEYAEAKAFNSLSGAERSNYIDSMLSRGATDYEIAHAKKYLAISKESLQRLVDDLEGKLACTRGKEDYLQSLFFKRAKPKPVFASWRSLIHFKEGDNCLMLKSSYDPDAPIKDRFNKITIRQSKLHGDLVIDGRWGDDVSVERPKLINRTTATIMLETEFEFLRKHAHYRKLWIEFEKRAAAESDRPRLEYLQKAFD